ncbi:MAG TPA: phage protein Gp27 family protein [Candidatus Binataceae bacterium]|nr:phage protein Gp27 family protein [Candidatus Binataceae bacterium]
MSGREKIAKTSKASGTGTARALPDAELKAELDRNLMAGRLANYEALAKWLGSQGCKIAPARPLSSGRGLEQKLSLVRLVTEQATAVIEAAPDDDNKLSAALLRLVQQHLFEMLVDLKTEGLAQKDIAKIANSVAQMTRATVMQQKWASELKAKIAEKIGAAEREVVAEVQQAASAGGGLSAEAESRIRRILLEITE